MRLTMAERRSVTTVVAKRYQGASKKIRGQILDEFVKLTGYRRSYAAFVLRNWKRRRVLTFDGHRTVYVFGPRPRSLRRRPTRPATYTTPVVRALKQLWGLSGGLCGKRLVPFIRQVLPVLERYEEIVVEADTRRKLRSISPATVDRLLAPERKRYQIKGRATTRPGTLLKHHVPIRTFADWNDAEPGFLEIDLVAHDGGVPAPEVIHSLNLTDIASGWTETRALKTKARRWVLEALQEVSTGLPFTIKGVDSDNGGEFINEELVTYCRQAHITFTRSRPWRKNDSCFVEQKNYSIVRKAVGYARYDTEQELLLLGQLYRALGLFTNFFVPVMKLKTKIRTGATVSKTYDTPKTPLQRVLEHSGTTTKTRLRLLRLKRTLNPAQLRRTISDAQAGLETLARTKPKPKPSMRHYRKLESLLT